VQLPSLINQVRHACELFQHTHCMLLCPRHHWR
jgi:hypothetical protein